MNQTIEWNDFEKVQLIIGTIIEANDFPEAKKPAYKLLIDLGPELGLKKSSAQITAFYTKETLVGKQVICVVNFKPRQVGPFMSQVLTTGFVIKEGVVLATCERPVPNGTRLV
jgi:tRNA-binding protein